jgi:hypothetical protein
VVKTITLSQPVYGQQIINAMIKLAGKGYAYAERIVDDKKQLLVGRSTEDPTGDLVISVDPVDYKPAYINLDAEYNFVAVVYHEWPGMKWAIIVYASDVEKEIEDFRNKLRELLGSATR